MGGISKGVVYLLHLEPPYKHAKHYLGYCDSYKNLDARFEYHAKGYGSRLLKIQGEAGGTFKLVKLWKGTRNDERRIKNMGHAAHFCSICGGTRKLSFLEEIVL